MSDAIVRLRLESDQYNQKLSNAVRELSRTIDRVRELGGTFAVADKEELEFVRSLGRLESSAGSTTQKLSDMKRQFVEMGMQYRRLTEEEKAAPWGQGLKASLDDLRGRIKESETALKDVNKELGSSSGMFNDLGKAVGVDISAFTSLATKAGLVAGAFKLLGGAMDLVKDSFMSSAANVREWAIVQEEASAVYQGFLYALNNGSIAGFLSNIGQIVESARRAKEAIMDLQKYSGINSVEVANIRAEETRLKGIIRREGKNSEAGKAAQAQLKALEPRMTRAWYNNSQDNRRAAREKLNEYLNQAGVFLNRQGLESTLNALSSRDAWNNFAANARGTITTTQTAASEKGVQWDVRDTRNNNAKVLDVLTPERREELQGYLRAQANARQQAFSNYLSNGRYVSPGKGGGGGGGNHEEEYIPQTQALNFSYVPAHQLSWLMGKPKDMNFEQLSAYQAARRREAQWMWAEQNQKPKSELQGGGIEMLDVKPLIDFSDVGDAVANRGELAAKNWSLAAESIRSVGAAFSAIEDPAAKVAGTIAQAIASVALGFAQASKGPFTTPWEWIAFAASGAATMLSTIASIKQATAGSYADGGVIPGNSWSGDNLTANVNSGEVLFNRGDAERLYRMVHDGSSLAGGQGQRLVADVHGSKLRLAIVNAQREMGKEVTL